MNNKPINRFRCIFPAKSVNEGFARSAMAAFASQLDPRVVHRQDALCGIEKRMVELRGEYYGDGRLVMTIKDCGRGISDIKQAMEPLFTTDPEGERSGMGFTVMESFTDRVRVRSKPGKGTVVRLEKNISIT